MNTLSAAQSAKPKKLTRTRVALLIYALICFSFVVVFSYLPLAGWSIAFFDYKPGISLFNTPFTGLKYFKMAIFEPELLPVLRNTLVLSFLTLLMTPIPAFFAILLSEMRSSKIKRIVQSITTLPNFISWVLVFTIAFVLFSAGDGIVNKIL